MPRCLGVVRKLSSQNCLGQLVGQIVAWGGGKVKHLTEAFSNGFMGGLGDAGATIFWESGRLKRK